MHLHRKPLTYILFFTSKSNSKFIATSFRNNLNFLKKKRLLYRFDSTCILTGLKSYIMYSHVGFGKKFRVADESDWNIRRMLDPIREYSTYTIQAFRWFQGPEEINYKTPTVFRLVYEDVCWEFCTVHFCHSAPHTILYYSNYYENEDMTLNYDNSIIDNIQVQISSRSTDVYLSNFYPKNNGRETSWRGIFIQKR